jgi:structural maintenance of chromosome 1
MHHSSLSGVRTNQLRGSQLQELLYKNSEGSTEEDRPRRGMVKLVFVTELSEQVSFSRHIQPSTSEPDAPHLSYYKINDKTVTWETYSSKLSSFGVLVKVRNFLVFQGDIEAVAAKSPAELTHLFEQISGSDSYKRKLPTWLF